MLVEGAFPRHDIFSHTAFGRPWVKGALGTALTFAFLYVLLVRELRATVALGAAAISFLFASKHFLARPHLLTFPIIVVWTAFLARASEERSRPSLWLLPLMVLWANLHRGFTVGRVRARGDHYRSLGRPPARCLQMVELLGRSPAGRHRYAIWISQPLADVSSAARRTATPNRRIETDESYTEFNQEAILFCLVAMSLLFGGKIGMIGIAMSLDFFTSLWRRVYADEVAVVHVRR